MTVHESVTQWIHQLKNGDPAAAQALWEHYFHRLVTLARARLRGTPCRVADQEDVALSAFDSFCRGLRQGRFPQLLDRDNLWELLIVITARKAINQIQRERRQKRGGGAVRGDSAFGPPDDSGEAGFAGLQGNEPSPDFAAEIAEAYQRLLHKLGDDELRRIAVCKLEGWTNSDIAEQLGCAISTIERRLRLIRTIWKDGQEGEKA
jgi:DNA-directed RNA polymerase specialized sigma24 family protein